MESPRVSKSCADLRVPPLDPNGRPVSPGRAPARRSGSAPRLWSVAPVALAVGLLSQLQADCGSSSGTVTAADLLALTSTCSPLPGVSKFANDSGGTASVSMCGLNGALWFKADMDIDCDGGSQSECTKDPYYQPETSCVSSSGDYLDASTLPFVVLPLDSNGFTMSSYGIKCGSVVAVIYGDQLEYGVVGDRGPKGVIGEASYAMADLFGINPDPISGGASSGVTYIVFTEGAVVSPIESHSAAQTLGDEEAIQLLADN